MLEAFNKEYDEKYLRQMKLFSEAYKKHLNEELPARFKMKDKAPIESSSKDDLRFSDRNKTSDLTINSIIAEICKCKQEYYDSFWSIMRVERETFRLSRPIQIFTDELIEFFKSLEKETDLFNKRRSLLKCQNYLRHIIDFDWAKYWSGKEYFASQTEQPPMLRFLNETQNKLASLIEVNYNLIMERLRGQQKLLENSRNRIIGEISRQTKDVYLKILDGLKVIDTFKSTSFGNEITNIIGILKRGLYQLLTEIIHNKYEQKENTESRLLKDKNEDLFCLHFFSNFLLDIIKLLIECMSQKNAGIKVIKAKKILEYIAIYKDEALKEEVQNRCGEFHKYLIIFIGLEDYCKRLHSKITQDDLHRNEKRLERIKQFYKQHIGPNFPKSRLVEEELPHFFDFNQFGVNFGARDLATDISKIQERIIEIIKNVHSDGDRLFTDTFLLFTHETLCWLRDISTHDDSKADSAFLNDIQKRINYYNAILALSGAPGSEFPLQYAKASKLMIERLEKIHKKLRQNLPEVTDLSSQLIKHLRLLIDKCYEYIAYIYMPHNFAGIYITREGMSRNEYETLEYSQTRYGAMLKELAKYLSSIHEKEVKLITQQQRPDDDKGSQETTSVQKVAPNIQMFKPPREDANNNRSNTIIPNEIYKINLPNIVDEEMLKNGIDPKFQNSRKLIEHLNRFINAIKLLSLFLDVAESNLSSIKNDFGNLGLMLLFSGFNYGRFNELLTEIRVQLDAIHAPALEEFDQKMYGANIVGLEQDINDLWAKNYLKANTMRNEIVKYCDEIFEIIRKISNTLKLSPPSIKYAELKRIAQHEKKNEGQKNPEVTTNTTKVEEILDPPTTAPKARL